MKYRKPNEKIELSGEMFDNPLDRGLNSHTYFDMREEVKWITQPGLRMEKDVDIKKVLKRINAAQEEESEVHYDEMSVEERQQLIDELSELDRGDEDSGETDQ